MSNELRLWVEKARDCIDKCDDPDEAIAILKTDYVRCLNAIDNALTQAERDVVLYAGTTDLVSVGRIVGATEMRRALTRSILGHEELD